MPKGVVILLYAPTKSLKASLFRIVSRAQLIFRYLFSFKVAKKLK